MEKSTSRKRKSSAQNNTSVKKMKTKSAAKTKRNRTEEDLGFTNVFIPAHKTAKWTTVSSDTKTYFQNIVTQNISYVLQNVNAPNMEDVECVLNRLNNKINKLFKTVKVPRATVKELADYGNIHSYHDVLEKLLTKEKRNLKEIQETVEDLENDLDSAKSGRLEKEVTELESNRKKMVGKLPIIQQSLDHFDDEDDDEDIDNISNDSDTDIYFEQLARGIVHVTEELNK